MLLLSFISSIVFQCALGTIDVCHLNYNEECPDPNIKVFLFTKNNTEIPESVIIGSNSSDSNLQETAFNSSKPTKIIIHGYSSSMNIPPLVEIRNEYLRTRDYNIFAIDWTALIQTQIQACYLGASWNARHVGNCSSQLIRIIRQLGATDIHVIGFSLGAQVTNFIANNLRPYNISRITGLDPALPLFVTSNKEEKLDSSDAEFVDVYHTDVFVFGQVERTGDVDFYMNGGVMQPGCWNSSNVVSCNHNRAPLYFAESINSEKGFWGWSCPWYWNFIATLCPEHEPLVLMGDKVNETDRGTYYVKTNSVPPFALGKYIETS